jgi:16S rRNA (guanine966-N2)-methyltransferase
MANDSKRGLSGANRRGGQRSGTKKPQPVGQVRIIAGDWRGRKLPVIDAEGLRPTGDRVRETVFNWLQMQIPGRDCLDLFAGSGALGLEAASRGAKNVVMVEASVAVAAALKDSLNSLQADESVSVLNMRAADYLKSSDARFDIVFIDPPFSQHLHLETLEILVASHLQPDALVYLELPTNQKQLLEQLPTSLTVHKERRFGDVSVYLFRFQ